MGQPDGDVVNERMILLAAGGTGGHLFSAFALSEELGNRGWTVDLATDMRGDRYGMGFPAREIHRLNSATIQGRSPVALAWTGITLARGIREANELVGRLKPAVVVGFGGYPCFPPMVAATLHGIPSALHEQNAVLGRANRMLAGRVTAIATSFEKVNFLTGTSLEKKAHLTGNPVRELVLKCASQPYIPPMPLGYGTFRLLVFGGSQGARFLSEMVPAALAGFDVDLRSRLVVTQQCRDEDLETVRNLYEQAGISALCETFFPDLPDRIAGSHLVVGRAGASSIAELTVIGRPSLLVPLPHALDNDQLLNATSLAEAGGGWFAPQAELTPERFREIMVDLMRDPQRLAEAAAAAKDLGRPDAVKRLADLVEELAAKRS